MVKPKIIKELSAVIRAQSRIQKISHQAHHDLGYDLNTIYMILLLQQAPLGIDITELGAELRLSSPALSIRISTSLRLGLVSVENVAQDRRTKRVFITALGIQTVQKICPELEKLLNEN